MSEWRERANKRRDARQDGEEGRIFNKKKKGQKKKEWSVWCICGLETDTFPFMWGDFRLNKYVKEEDARKAYAAYIKNKESFYYSYGYRFQLKHKKRIVDEYQTRSTDQLHT